MPNLQIMYLWISIIDRFIQNMINSHSVFQIICRYVAHSGNETVKPHPYVCTCVWGWGAGEGVGEGV
jgi:hypothetical protein